MSVHIPKTAGTMLGQLFDHASNRRVLWDYDPEYGNTLTIHPLWLDHISFIKSYFWGIHGHFYYLKFASVLPDATYITCVRHPVDRLVSQFKHEVYNAATGQQSWRLNDLLSGRMDAVGFVASDENIRRAQVIHLQGRDIADYDFIFIHEYITNGLHRFGQRFNFERKDPDIDRLPEVNSAAQRHFVALAQRQTYERLANVTEAQKVAVYNLIPEEIDQYQRIVSHWHPQR